MIVESLLDQANTCTSQPDAEKLLDTLVKHFGKARPLAHLFQNNREAQMEGHSPFVRFEINHVINDHYITTIRPEIRGGAIVIGVITNHMLDGFGIYSQSWKEVEDTETTIFPEVITTLAELAQMCKDIGIANHAKLIESVGVPPAIALSVAKKSWGRG